MHDTNLLEDQPIAWTPTPDVIERAQLTKFMRQVGVATWDELYEFSIRDVERFTEEVLKFLDIRFDPPYTKLLDTSEGIEFPKWFQQNADTPVRSSVASTRTGTEDAKTSTGHEGLAGGTGDADRNVRAPAAGLNITEMCLDRWISERGHSCSHPLDDSPAIIWEGENRAHWHWTYEELLEQVEFCASGLRHSGIGKGDAVGIYLPMTQDIVTVLLAIGRVGAIAVPVFSGYGVEAIVSRMNAVEAKAIFVCTGFERRGKRVDSYSIAKEAVAKCPTISKVIVRDTVGIGPTLPDERYIDWHELMGLHCNVSEEDWRDNYYPEPTSAEDPLIILYTSGTTGKPKGIAHTHASFPIKAAQDMAFGTDVGRGTRICWYTDIGWMMGPWLIYGALINGATICLYDGAPDYPTPDRMWEFCSKHKVEILGIAPTLVRSLAAREAESPASAGGEAPDHISSSSDAGALPPAYAGGSAPFQRHDLSSLRAFASSGEPWNPGPWWWLFEKVGNSKIPIINYSGGTEISGGILMGNPLLPQKPCSFPAPCPGMDADILDEEGNSVPPGKVGELVLKQPWIGMARGFWRERERYLETYWNRFPGIWVHGDWAMRDEDGHWFILGRSDDTLKVAGKRVGPAEVESLLVAHPLVTEAAVIGVPDEVKGTAMVAFCVVGSPPSKGGVAAASADGLVNADLVRESEEGLQQELKSLVAKDMGKPLAPSKIHFVSALPKTRNAKVMRRVIRSAYLGEDPGDLSALENPNAIYEIGAAGR